jgi:hypothetical protein
MNISRSSVVTDGTTIPVIPVTSVVTTLLFGVDGLERVEDEFGSHVVPHDIDAHADGDGLGFLLEPSGPSAGSYAAELPGY